MKLPSNSLSNTLISVSHLHDAAPIHPGTKARAGNPWCLASGPLFISSTFEGGDDTVWFELFQVGQAQGQRLLHFSADGQDPGARVQRAWLVHVITHKEMRDRRDPGFENVHRHFQIEKASRAHNHA